MSFDPSRLKSQLLNTGLQVKDNPLFQVINLLIDATSKINADINITSGGGGGGGGGSVIVENSIAELANSRIGYTFTVKRDESYKNKPIYPPGNNIPTIDFPLAPGKGGTGTSIVFTEGSVVFAGPGGVYAQDNSNFFYDDVVNTLILGGKLVTQGVGQSGLQIVAGSAFDGANVIALNNVSTGTSCISRFQMATDSVNNIRIDGYGSNFSGNALQRANGSAVYGLSSTGLAIGATDTAGFVTFHAGGLTEWLCLTPTGLFTFQGITSASPALKREGTLLRVRLADDSGGGIFGAGEFAVGNINADSKVIIGAPDAGVSQIEFQADRGDNNPDYAFIRKEDNGNFIISNAGFGNPSTPHLVVDLVGNIGIGTLPAPGAGTAGLIFADGTALSGMPSNTAGLYANDVGGIVNMFAINESDITFPLGGVLFDHFADSTVGGAEADIYTNTLAANTFSANGDKVVATYGGNFVTVGTELTDLQVYFAGTSIWDSTGVAPTAGTTSWRVHVELIRVSSSVVRYTVSLNTTGASGYVYCTVGELTGLTLSGTNILKITGTSSGVGSGSGDIVGKMGYVEFKPA